VSYRGSEFRIGRVKKPNKDFAIVEIEGKNIVTQNMEKPSSWTKWVNDGPDRKLTWIIDRSVSQGSGFIGKIQQEGEQIRVFKLNPESMLLECSLALQE
jgi:hypothetical protein